MPESEQLRNVEYLSDPEPASGPGTVVLGRGVLAEALRRKEWSVDEPDGDFIVVVSDAWDTRPYAEVGKRAAESNVAWLPVRTELGRVVIGPTELPGVSGCVTCADTRRWRARQDSRGRGAVWQRHGDALLERSSSWLTVLAADVVADLVADEVRRAHEAPATMRTRSTMLYLDLRSVCVSAHRILPDPHCGECGELPDDNEALADLAMTPRPKRAPHDYRVRDVGAEFEALQSTYVDAETGLIRRVHRGSEGGFAVAAAPMGLRDGAVESGYGRTRSYRASELTAVLEALERYGGMRPGGKRTTVRASYRDVSDRALDPLSLGVHSAEAYALPDFRFRPFDEHQPYPWVWGYSFARQEPVLVPESYGYYRAPRTALDAPPFVYEISNGCALGGCLEEAALYGILEVAERDAFLLTWYARLAAGRIDPDSARDRSVALMADVLRAETGYEIMLFDITAEQRIPSVWAMAVDRDGAAGRPQAVCAAGSHLDPERAAENAVSELGPIVSEYLRRYPERQDRARAMAADPSLVREMSDHWLVNASPAAFDRLRFLADASPSREFADLPQADEFGHDDLTKDLRALVGRYLDTGLDVVVVDQTTPEHRAGNLACVKVIVPGTLPMTFGHHFRRIDGLPRLHHVPQLLGYRDAPLDHEDINPHPHPFP